MSKHIRGLVFGLKRIVNNLLRRIGFTARQDQEDKATAKKILVLSVASEIVLEVMLTFVSPNVFIAGALTLACFGLTYYLSKLTERVQQQWKKRRRKSAFAPVNGGYADVETGELVEDGGFGYDW
ncbi:hypothetical protein KMW28_27165 [Flammeovirga yaeyamensis]|uniref:Uncharacterized protein n=1 Tax=Flammeovirga yaeyamensis TaxID=367791 RepID=A0AAX1NCA9_9BACT|nr:hypothetical protein [Flammeovirga yaeyamensis]MBB3700039.1 peptidoglycan biosynthesis protein MviN/MurJ (putative lipid II flippase) [Flammeovirga yaeyamensis]NMF37524.1 hypothetical protein [Flammeovirga yaeyamensis]QWG04581.1 hypothetical protein KMW28_27165 [Flammeovirga yaeyamensis]